MDLTNGNRDLGVPTTDTDFSSCAFLEKGAYLLLKFKFYNDSIIVGRYGGQCL